MTEWRVGNHNPRNLYIGDEHVAVTVGDNVAAGALAHRIVAAMNHTENLAQCDRACPDCHKCMCACDDDNPPGPRMNRVRPPRQRPPT
jgi:hypothetical protein